MGIVIIQLKLKWVVKIPFDTVIIQCDFPNLKKVDISSSNILNYAFL